MPLTQEQKKQYKSIGHHLKPVLTVADNGLTEGVLAELERALGDHELIKIKVTSWIANLAWQPLQNCAKAAKRNWYRLSAKWRFCTAETSM